MRNNDQDMIRVILARMAMDPGLSERKLASSAGQTRHLVRLVKKQLAHLGISAREACAMTDAALDAAFPASSRKLEFIEPDWNEVWQFMNPTATRSTPRQEVQLSSAWEKYASQFQWDGPIDGPLPEGCMSRATFIRRYHEYCHDSGKPDRSTAPSLSFRRGELMEVDTIGDRFRFATPDRVLHSVKLFTAVLKYSGLVFAEATERTQTRDWVRCTADAFRFFGGVPQTVRSDNDPAIVVAGRRGEGRRLQPAYEALLRAYGATSDLAPVRRPTYKGLVERANGILIQELFSHREGGVVEAASLEDYNRQLLEEVERINRRKGRSGTSRREVFEACERGSLRQLPCPAPEPREIRLCKVNADGYVSYGGNYYFAGAANSLEQIIAEEAGGRKLVLSKGMSLDSARQIATYELCLERHPRPMRFKAASLLSEEEKAVRRNKEWFASQIPECCGDAGRLLDELWGGAEGGSPLAAKRSSALMRLLRKSGACEGDANGARALNMACGKALELGRASDLSYVEHLLSALLEVAAELGRLEDPAQEPGAPGPAGEKDQSNSNSFTRGTKYYEKFYSRH